MSQKSLWLPKLSPVIRLPLSWRNSNQDARRRGPAPRASVEIGASAPPPPSWKRPNGSQSGQARLGLADWPTGPGPAYRTGPTEAAGQPRKMGRLESNRERQQKE